MKMKLVATLMILASSFVVLGQNATTVVEVLPNDQELTSFAEWVVQLGYVETLSGTGPFTVFAPTNAAFSAISTAGMTADEINRLFLNHVIVGSKIQRNEFRTGYEVVANGVTLTIAVQGDASGFVDHAVLVGSQGSHIIGTPLDATNGIVHKVTGVLIPPPPGPVYDFSQENRVGGGIGSPGTKTSGTGKISKKGKRERNRF